MSLKRRVFIKSKGHYQTYRMGRRNKKNGLDVGENENSNVKNRRINFVCYFVERKSG